MLQEADGLKYKKKKENTIKIWKKKLFSQLKMNVFTTEIAQNLFVCFYQLHLQDKLIELLYIKVHIWKEKQKNSM